MHPLGVLQSPNRTITNLEYVEELCSGSRRIYHRRMRIGRIVPSNTFFARVANYKSYSLQIVLQPISPVYPEKVSSYHKRIDLQMVSRLFSRHYPITVLGFLMEFRNACEHNGVSEGVVIWLFQYFTDVSAKDNIKSRLNTCRSILVYEEVD